MLRALSFRHRGKCLPQQLMLVVVDPGVRRDDARRNYVIDHAAAACSKSSPSNSSSTGEKVLSALVESVIGFNPPWDRRRAHHPSISLEATESRDPTTPATAINFAS